MRKLLYVISMFFYVLSLVGTFAQFPLAFMGYSFIGAFFGSENYAMVLSVILITVSVLCHTLAVFKNKKYIYVTRAILFLGSLFNLLVFGFGADMIASLIISVALLVMTFIEKTEYVISNTVTQEELVAIEKENADAKTISAIGNIISFFVLPIILSITIGICAMPFEIKYVNELKEEYRKDLPIEMATEEQCNEFNVNNYEELGGNWYLDTVTVTKMLESNSNTDDYWMVGDNLDIVYHLFYDSWDNVADEHTLIRTDYKYPDPETAKVSKICFASNFANGYNKEDAITIDLTEKEIEEIRYFIMGQNYDEGKTQYYDEEYYEHERKLDILWCFDGEDALYYEYGKIVKTSDGKYHLRANPSYYTVYTLPDEICERLEKVW